MDDLDAPLDADDEKLVAQFMQESLVKHVINVQKSLRRFLARCRIHEYIAAKYEKIYDPKRGLHYYYNIETDKSSWSKPALLLKSDMSFISPTYTIDEAVIMIQRQGRRRIALKRVRILYKALVTENVDVSSGQKYYYNRKSGQSLWQLPDFMNNIFDHKYKDGTKKKDGKTAAKLNKDGTEVVAGVEGEEEVEIEVEEEDPVGDDSSDDSNVSDDSGVARMKRVLARKFPRYLHWIQTTLVVFALRDVCVL